MYWSNSSVSPFFILSFDDKTRVGLRLIWQNAVLGNVSKKMEQMRFFICLTVFTNYIME